ncbi:MAG TPA: hypothetical protein VI300_01415, partial [Solirubrobacter sp.]
MRRDPGLLAAATAAAIAVVVLVGAATGIDALQDFGGARAMLPIGAVAVLTAAAGLARWRVLGAPLLLGAVVALAQPLPGGNDIPVNAAVCLALTGAALLALDRRPSFADACALVVATIAG